MMVETILRIDATEVSIVRVECCKCHLVTECPVGDLAKTFKDLLCPFCKVRWDARNWAGENPFVDLQAAIEDFGKSAADFRVQLSVPSPKP